MRLDSYLNNEFNTGREKAKELIKDKNVLVNDVVVTKPAFDVLEDMIVTILDEDFNKYVSRGAYKLLQAMEEYSLSVEGKKCIDVGASTGGFTDVLVQNGASTVVAVDTGTDQLHQKLRDNSIVKSLESTNILNIKKEDYGTFDVVTCDASFVSIKKLLPHISTLLNSGATCVFLVKPQFEVGQNKLNKKGVVRDLKDRENALKEVVDLCTLIGFKDIKTTISKTVGHSGNIEYLLVCNWG